MKKIRTVLTLTLTVVMVFSTILLSGCSDNGTSAGTPFSQTLNAEDGVRIWYECQNKIKEEKEDTDLTNLFSSEEETVAEPTVFGRETKVIWIKVYKDGKVTSYSCAENIYLGYFAKMSDEEILKELESNPDKYFIGNEAEPYEIYLYTDATGQEVVFEGVPAQIKMSEDADPMYYMTLFSKETIPTFQVYDSYYGGYVLYNYDETGFAEACIVTRCEEGASFGLDSLDLEGAVVDYATPEDMLHEKNAELKEKLKAEKKEEAKAEGDGETEADEEKADGEADAAEEDADGEADMAAKVGN